MAPSVITTCNLVFSVLYGGLGVFLYVNNVDVLHDPFLTFPLCIGGIFIGLFFVRVNTGMMMYPSAFMLTLAGIFYLLEGGWGVALFILILVLFMSALAAGGRRYRGREGLCFQVTERGTIDYKKIDNNYTEGQMWAFAIPFLGLFFAGWETYQRLK